MKFKTASLNLAGLLAIAAIVGCSKSAQYDSTLTNKPVAQKITCVNNLKEIGLAFRVWAGDHGDKMPFNVNTNAGGTMELCSRGKDGFDANAWLHFQVMSNELNSPLVLVCPQDKARKPAADWSSLAASNVTYRLHTGTNVNLGNPHEILVVCPVDGNTLYCDGTVVSGK